MHFLRPLRGAAVAVLFPMAVAAQSAGTVEVGLFARHNLYGDTLRLAPAPGLGARMGVFLFPSLALEGDLAWARPGVRNLPDTATLRSVTHPLLSARLTYHQRIDDRARLLLGLGYAFDAYTGDRTVAPQGAGPSALVGLRFRVTDRLAARAEGTGTWVVHRRGIPVAVPAHVNIGAQAGVTWQLFGRPRDVPVRTDTIRVVQRDTVYITRIDTVYIKGPAGRPVVVGSVNFALNGQELSPEAKKILDLIAESLLDPVNLTRTVAVTGNTDGIGSERYNLRLGQLRADRAKAYLTSKGIAAERIQARTQGESDPVAPNSTADGRATNRRVLIILTN
jgi:outer membrane protein OmpA-like peptidoglycan-associated protein